MDQHSIAVIQATSLEGFMQLMAAVLCVTRGCLQHCSRMRSVLEEGLRAGRTPRTQWGPLLDQMQEAAQAVSEVASGRWAKLLGSRYILLLLFQMDCSKQIWVDVMIPQQSSAVSSDIEGHWAFNLLSEQPAFMQNFAACV